MQKEIEIKIKLDCKYLELLKQWLLKNSEFWRERVIIDHYFDNAINSYLFDSGKGYEDALEFLRLRITDNENILCYKKRNVDENGKTLSVEEVETVITDSNKTIQILNNINFIEKICIKKKRKIYLVEDIFEVAIDDIEKLGVFIEIELKNDIQDVEVGINKIYELLKKIGIKEFIEFDRGYFCMFLNPGYDFGKDKKF